MRLFFSGLFFLPLVYGFYILGFHILRAVEVYKSVPATLPLLPISKTAFFIFGLIIFIAEIVLIFVYKKATEEF